MLNTECLTLKTRQIKNLPLQEFQVPHEYKYCLHPPPSQEPACRQAGLGGQA